MRDLTMSLVGCRLNDLLNHSYYNALQIRQHLLQDALPF